MKRRRLPGDIAALPQRQSGWLDSLICPVTALPRTPASVRHLCIEQIESYCQMLRSDPRSDRIGFITVWFRQRSKCGDSRVSNRSPFGSPAKKRTDSASWKLSSVLGCPALMLAIRLRLTDSGLPTNSYGACRTRGQDCTLSRSQGSLVRN